MNLIKKLLIVGLLTGLLSFPFNGALASNPEKTDLLTRGEAADLVVEFFKLEEKNGEFLKQCALDKEICYFEFLSRTNYEVKLKPLILYPDVFPSHSYYQAINTLTALGLVRGYFQAENSPFGPDRAITKAEALKLIMGASGQLNWKDQFELSLPVNLESEKIGAEESVLIAQIAGVPTIQKLLWWYPRYWASGLKVGLLREKMVFKPEDFLTRGEFEKLLESSLVNANQEANPQENFIGNIQSETQPG